MSLACNYLHPPHASCERDLLLSPLQVVRLHQLLHEARFDEPNGDHLSPAGEYNLRLGVMKELRPELIATHQGEGGGRGGAPELIATHQGERGGRGGAPELISTHQGEERRERGGGCT